MYKLTKTKKALTLMLATFMLFAVLMSGCGSNDGAASGKDKTAAGDKTAVKNENTEDKGKPYEIMWYTIGSPQKDIPDVMEELSKYTKEKINATVKMTQFNWGDDYNNKMNVIISSGEPYDLCFTCSWANQYLPNVARNAFLPVDDLLKEYGKGIIESENPLFLEANKVNGKLYAIPVNKELSAQSRWLFNKTLVEKYKLDISKPLTLEELEPMLRTVKEGEKDIGDLLVVRNDFNLPRQADDYEWAAGTSIPMVVPMSTKDYKVIEYFEQPDVLKSLDTMRKYFNAGYIRKDAATSTDQDYKKTGKWFVRIGGWLPGADQIWSREEKDPVVSTPITGDLYISGSQLSGSMIAISATSKNPEKSMEFLNLLNTDKFVRNMVDSGIENVHYKMENGKQIDLEKGTNDYNMPSFSLGNRFICNLYQDDPDDLWDQYKSFNDSGIKSPILGFNSNLDGVKKEVAALSNIHAEFYRPIVTGTVDYKSYLPKYMDKMNSNGYDAVKKELQKQIDEWKAANGK
ncbi:putative aldouronate transport system substrate-binding protein [Anaerobacterium chartisolvens]|uniref:Putative aldouronate transport system substrate-binding protein n=2 Tax=Anaerobacterium chartisolvens TaxID=1297424 RepID=A0A369BDU8_9FIRM|nr:putative aldouronate transport system substrate-binding protein [Anaerobacterium chartisolvens]